MSIETSCRTLASHRTLGATHGSQKSLQLPWKASIRAGKDCFLFYSYTGSAARISLEDLTPLMFHRILSIHKNPNNS